MSKRPSVNSIVKALIAAGREVRVEWDRDGKIVVFARKPGDAETAFENPWDEVHAQEQKRAS
jgi:hypothetical protein